MVYSQFVIQVSSVFESIIDTLILDNTFRFTVCELFSILSF